MGVAVFRRGVARLLAVVLFVLAPGLVFLPPAAAADPVVENVVTFADVSELSLFYKEISWLASEGISTGWLDGGVRQYRPGDSIARDAMAAFLYRKAGSPAFTAPDSSPFTDVAPEGAFYKEISWLASKGISTGWDVGGGKREYRPWDPIARDAMAAFLYRYAQPAQFTAPVVSPFVDVAAGGAFYREITWLASAGISTGWDVGGGLSEYRPWDPIARNAMAAFLYRYAAEKVPADPLAPDAGTVTVAPDVEVLDAGQLDTAQVTGGVVTLPSDQATEIHPNDVLVAGVTPGTPEGLLVRVVQIVRDPDGNTVVKTRPATLTEAVLSTSGLIEISGTPHSSTFIPEPDVTVTTAAGAAPLPGMVSPEALVEGEVFVQSFSLKKTIRTIETVTGTDELHGGGSIALESSISTSAKAKMTLEAGFLQLKEASVVLSPSFTAKHSANVSGTLEGRASAKLGVLKAVIVFGTGVPLVVTVEAEVAVNLTATGTAEASYVTSQTVSSGFGFKYREGAFNLVHTKPQATGVQNDVKAAASLTATLSLDFDADIRLYGVAGITFGAGPYASAAIAVFNANGTRTWSCPLEHGFASRIGVVAGIEVMGFKLAEWSKEATATWKFAELNPCEGTPVVAPAPMPPSPLAITTTALPDATAGGPYSASLTAAGGSRPYTWALVSGNLPNGLLLDPVNGTVTGTAAAAGTFDATFEVTDSAAAVDRQTLRFSVRPASTRKFVYSGGTRMVLKTDGTVWVWGSVPGTLSESAVPVQVPGLTGVSDISFQASSVFAVKSDGTLWGWGANTNGELGNGTTTPKAAPVRIGSLTDVRSIFGIDAVYRSVYALKNDGSVWAWGDNADGELGNGTTTDSLVPQPVPGLSGVQHITNAGDSIVALKADGTVWAWGDNRAGQLGNGSQTASHTPSQVTGLTGVQRILATDYTLHAMKSDGTVWAWGDNFYGQLGTGEYTALSAVPVHVAALDTAQAVTSQNTGQFASFYSVKADGTVWAWGNNFSNQLGIDRARLHMSPAPIPVPGPVGVKEVRLDGLNSAFAIKVDGSLWSWGGNSSGILGNGATTPSVPAQVQGLTDIRAVEVIEGRSAFAVRADGGVWAWGKNHTGQLGNGTLDASLRPTQVVGMNDAQRVMPTGFDGVFALRTDGTLWSWGDNFRSQLGTGTTAVNSPVPVQVARMAGS